MGAHTLLVAAHGPAGIAIYEVDPGQPGVTRTASPPMDPTRRLTSVTLRQAHGVPIGPVCTLEPLRDLACVALSAEQVGAAAGALERTVHHARTREQFGQPIGSFQALAHRMADLHVLVEGARSASLAAARALQRDTPEAGLLAGLAAVHCAETLTAVAGEMIQIHGAAGITWEHDAHLFFKRAHGSTQLFGSPGEHITRLAAVLIDGVGSSHDLG
jgi:alkylation response protein AidB-like acyl-CoA dehydrogenase